MKKVEELLKRPYARVITPAPEGGYTAEIIEFPGCVTQGETVEEAYANLEDAARGWLEAVIEIGQSIPEPSAEENFSGKVVLRLPKSLHRKASACADRDGVSLNTFLATAIAEHVGERARERGGVSVQKVTEVKLPPGGKRTATLYGVETVRRPANLSLLEPPQSHSVKARSRGQQKASKKGR